MTLGQAATAKRTVHWFGFPIVDKPHCIYGVWIGQPSLFTSSSGLSKAHQFEFAFCQTFKTVIFTFLQPRFSNGNYVQFIYIMIIWKCVSDTVFMKGILG